MLNNQDKWVLGKLQQAGFDAIISGPTVRDFYIKQSSPSVDIYIFVDIGNYMVSRYLRHENLAQLLDLGNGSADSVNAQCTHSQESWVVLKNNTQYNLIILEEPTMSFSHKSQIGLNKAFYDGIKYHYSREFLKDINNKTITLLRADDIADLNHHIQVIIPSIRLLFPSFTCSVDEITLKKGWRK